MRKSALDSVAAYLREAVSLFLILAMLPAGSAPIYAQDASAPQRTNMVPPARQWTPDSTAPAGPAVSPRTLPRRADVEPQAASESNTVPPAVTPAAVTPIQHVIIIIGENRGFDHLFATYTPAGSGQTINNLLSEGVITATGTAGTKYSVSDQYSASDTTTYSPSPGSKAVYANLPPIGTSEAHKSASNSDPSPFSTVADAEKYEPDLPSADYTELTTGATGIAENSVDTRVADYNSLPSGVVQITPSVSYDSYTGDPVHRFYQMWQQNDCSSANVTTTNPSGCLHDLYPWVDITIGIGSDGDAQPSPFTNITTGDGSISMIYYNMQAGDVPYFKSLANSYTISDNFHQSVMGGTGPNHIMFGYADMLWYSNGSGTAETPPTNEIENPNPDSGTNNWYDQDGYSGGSYSNCSDTTQPGVAPVVNYLESLNPPISSNCASGHYYLLNNYNPGYNGTSGLQSGTYVIPPVNTPHIGDAMTAGGLTWTYFGEGWTTYVGDPNGTDTYDRYCNICNPFQYASDIMTSSSEIAAHIQDTSSFFSDVTANTLPAVSIIKPDGFVDGHPASSKTDLFEGFVDDIVTAVQANSTLWANTAIFITFDESGGFYDSGYIQPLDFFGDGPRIPLIVVSPYSTGGIVNHSYSDHVSLDKFIERNWGLGKISTRSRDNFPNPTVGSNPYIPTNSPAIDDLFDCFNFASFSLAASPATVTVAAGNSGTSTITSAVSGGFDSAVALTASGEPAGVTVSFSPTSIAAPGSGTSTMTITVGSSVANGNYPITVTGAGGGLTETVQVTLTVASTSSSFTIAASPSSVSVAAGSNGASTITTTAVGAFDSAVALSASGQPTGVTVAFSPTSIAAPGTGTSTMTLTVGSSTVAGTYPITVTGTGGGVTETVSVSLTVTTPNFTIAASPTSVSVAQGSSGSSTITTTVVSGFDSAVALSASGQPTGVTVAFSPASIAAPGSGTSTMTMTVASTAATGSYPITVTGTGGGDTHTATVTLSVTSSTGCTPDILSNGSFATGTLACWTTAGTTPPTVSTAQTYSSSYSALLGTTAKPEVNGNNSLSQTITVPTGATTTLTYWYYPGTNDTITYAYQEAQIQNTSGTTLAEVMKVASNTLAWTEVAFDLTPYAGQTIQLYFNVHGSGSSSYYSYMYLDDVAVTSTTTQLIENGSFTTGTLADWTTGGAVIPTVSTAETYSSSYSALLGTTAKPEVNGSSDIYQTVTIPSSATKAILNFWYWPTTNDTITYAYQEAQVQNSSGTTLAEVLQVASNAKAWTEVTYDLSSYIGQTVRIYLNVHGEGSSSYYSGMYVDGISVTVN